MRFQPIYDIAELCSRHGIDEAILCPGSRCAPLTIAFARHPKITTRTISDERSAAFVAMGIAQQKKRPAVMICTSGTATYNFAPAIAESYYQRIPLLVFTADRPPEWIGQWDGQTINQTGIYGSHVKGSYQLPADYGHDDAVHDINRIVNEAIHLAKRYPPGPVHVNVPIREPLYPNIGEPISFGAMVRTVDQPLAHRTLDDGATETLNQLLRQHTRVLLVVGQHALDEPLTKVVRSFCTRTSVPVVADVTSNLHQLELKVGHADAILGACPDQVKEELKPALLISFGKSILSKNLKLFLRKFKPADHWHITEDAAEIIDPLQSITRVIESKPEDFFSRLKEVPAKGQKEYHRLWVDHDKKVQSATSSYLEGRNDGELAFVRHLLQHLPDKCNLHLANSMPVRYANLIGVRSQTEGTEIFANRGTSGIDGCSSTAVGHTLASPKLNILISGDMAFFYDRNAFWHNYPMPNLRIAVLNNHGGTIFSMIDGPGGLPERDEFFVTHQRLTANKVAEEYGFHYQRVSPGQSPAAAIKTFLSPGDRPKIIEFESDSSRAQELFLELKGKIKDSYAT